MATDNISSLTAEFQAFMKQHRIPKDAGDASEILMSYKPLTKQQRDWIRKFIARWEAVEARGDRKVNGAVVRDLPVDGGAHRFEADRRGGCKHCDRERSDRIHLMRK